MMDFILFIWIVVIIVTSIVTGIHMFMPKIPCNVCQLSKPKKRFSEGNIQYWKDSYYEHEVQVAVCKSCEATHEIDRERMESGEVLPLSGFVKRKDSKPRKLISWDYNTPVSNSYKHDKVIRIIGRKL